MAILYRPKSPKNSIHVSWEAGTVSYKIATVLYARYKKLRLDSTLVNPALSTSMHLASTMMRPAYMPYTSATS
ncbi:hypothetical protein CDV31_017372 [Fusarium ambrosium]|uniref:Uncharacterized protein n=1 Tax=Fusarium ambrosium TaxID=131363 RepID=A0A428RG68_9HYPO|nr:hypothetical protein CDV31_017372 [Fusarium ambrosium]